MEPRDGYVQVVRRRSRAEEPDNEIDVWEAELEALELMRDPVGAPGARDMRPNPG